MTPSQAHRHYRDTRFFASLDGLRAICIFLVLWHHSPLFGFFGAGAAEPRILTRGLTGVDFFFVLSGFLITTLLLREEAAKGRFSLRGFYRRRILRIVPVYFLVVTLVGGWFIFVRGQDQYLDIWPYYYAFLSNYLLTDIPTLAPTWSLSVEEQYYIVWPLLLALLPARAGLRIALLAFVLVYAFLVLTGVLPGLPAYRTDVALFAPPLASFAAILIGALLAILLHTPRGFALLWPVLGRVWMPLALFVLLLLLWQVLPGKLVGWPNFLMHPTMAAIIGSLVVRGDHLARPVLTWRPFARIGTVSYGLYLWHLIGLHVATELYAALGLSAQGGAGALGLTALFVVMSIAIAEASFRLFEVHFLALKTPRAQRPRPTTVRQKDTPGDQAG